MFEYGAHYVRYYYFWTGVRGYISVCINDVLDHDPCELSGQTTVVCFSAAWLATSSIHSAGTLETVFSILLCALI